MLMCGVGAKSVAPLMKFHLLQWEVVKEKFLMNSNMTAKHQLPTPYGFRDIALTRFYRSRSLRQGQRSNQGQTMTLHTYTS